MYIISYYVILCHLFYILFFFLFSYFFSSDFIFSIMSLIYQFVSIVFYYVGDSHPNLQKQTPILVLCAERWLSSVLGRQRSFVMSRGPCFIKPNQHSKLNDNYYTHCFILYLLFWLFDQYWAARNLDLRTAGQHTSNQWEVSCHCIKKKALIAGTCVQSMPFSFVLFALCHYFFILYLLFQKSKKVIWVRIPCIKPANWHIHHWELVSIHTKSIHDSIIKHQGLLSHGGSWRNRPIGIGLTDVRERSRQQFRLEPIGQCIKRPGNGSALFLPDVICNSEFDANLWNNWFTSVNSGVLIFSNFG